MVVKMKQNNKNKKENDEHPSLLEVFRFGDNVKQFYFNPNGTTDEYKGYIVVAKEEHITVWWDTINSMVQQTDENIRFTNYQAYEIFDGDTLHSPIKKINPKF